MEPVAYPTTTQAMRANIQCWEPVLATATRVATFLVPGTRATYESRVAVVNHRDMLAVLVNLTWLFPVTFQPELAWLRGLRPDQLTRWVVLCPYQSRDNTRRMLMGHGPFSIFERKRTGTGAFGVFSEARHRNAAYRIAGITDAQEDPEADALTAPATAAIIVYPSIEPGTLGGREGDEIDPTTVTLGFHIITPFSSAPADGKLIKWVTIDSGNPRAVAVEARPDPR